MGPSSRRVLAAVALVATGGVVAGLYPRGERCVMTAALRPGPGRRAAAVEVQFVERERESFGCLGREVHEQLGDMDLSTATVRLLDSAGVELDREVVYTQRTGAEVRLEPYPGTDVDLVVLRDREGGTARFGVTPGDELVLVRLDRADGPEDLSRRPDFSRPGQAVSDWRAALAADPTRNPVRLHRALGWLGGRNDREVTPGTALAAARADAAALAAMGALTRSGDAWLAFAARGARKALRTAQR